MNDKLRQGNSVSVTFTPKKGAAIALKPDERPVFRMETRIPQKRLFAGRQGTKAP